MKQYLSIIGVCLLAFYACVPSEEAIQIEQPADKQLEFAARKNAIITRAGETYESFSSGTLYDLFALDCAAHPNYWTGDNAVLYAQRGEEYGGFIDYRSTNGQLAYFNKRTIDFYGVTLGATTAPQVTPASAPAKYTIEVDANGDLPDLMRAYEPNRTVSQGVITLDFKHTVSKLTLEVGQQVTTAGVNVFAGVYIEKIKLTNMYQTGTLDVATSNYTKSGMTERTFYDRSGGTKIPVAETPYRFDREILIFPRETGETQDIAVEITLGKDGDAGWPKTVSCPLKYAKTDANGNLVTNAGQQVYEDYSFQPNYEYILTLMLIDGTMKLVILSPQVYEWVDVDANETEAQGYLGKPATFAGLMWMDRNLGAQSTDCLNEWDKTVGYFYQYGRNLPYMFDIEKWRADGSPTTTNMYGTAISLDYIYTYNDSGGKVYGYVEARSSFMHPIGMYIPLTAQYTVISPGGSDASRVEFRYITDINSGGAWSLTGAGIESTDVNQRWTVGVENQPCPSGWRMPTNDDFATFLPHPALTTTGDAAFFDTYRVSLKGTTSGRDNRMLSGIATDDYISFKENIANTMGTAFLCKYSEDAPSYRIRIRFYTNADGKRYAEVARFSVNSSVGFSAYAKQSGETDAAASERFLNSTDWTYPSETFTIPMTGYLYPYNMYSLQSYGNMTLLRSRDYVSSSNSYSAYLRFDGVFGNSNANRKAVGGQIRCVRDLN